MNDASTVYAAATLSPHDAQLLLTLALFCLVLGVALAQKRALMAFIDTVLTTKAPSVPEAHSL